MCVLEDKREDKPDVLIEGFKTYGLIVAQTGLSTGLTCLNK